jgi:hypothetical protein
LKEIDIVFLYLEKPDRYIYKMTKSNKHKNERKKDFQKEKLKVGKARPKNTNATDTSFAAKCTQPLDAYK